MGAPPPTRMAPMDTCTDERRLMLMGTCGANSTVARLGRHSLKAAIIRKPESVCSERVRREPERRRRKFRPETLRHKNGRRRTCNLRGASGERWIRKVVHPPKGSGAYRAPDLSGHRTEGWQAPWREGVAPAAFFVWRICGKTDPAFQAAPGAGRPHRRLRRLGHAGAVQLADRRAPRGAPRGRRVRRVAHVCRGPAWRARARVAAAAAGE